VLEPLKQGGFGKRNFFLSFRTQEKAPVLTEECVGANFRPSNFSVCFALSKKRNYIVLQAFIIRLADIAGKSGQDYRFHVPLPDLRSVSTFSSSRSCSSKTLFLCTTFSSFIFPWRTKAKKPHWY